MQKKQLCERILIKEQSLFPAAAPFGTFYCGDTISLIPQLLKNHSESVQLLYIDPPFFTGHDFKVASHFGSKGFKGDRDFIADVPLYSDKWNSIEEYINFIRIALEGAKELLSPTGVICVHIDWRTSAHIRLLLDSVFGQENFINELIWHYRSGGGNKKAFARKHDTLFLYGKTKDYRINPLAIGEIRGQAQRNHMKKQIDEDGRVFFSIMSAGKEYRYYEDEIIPFDDVWELPHLQQKHPERTGYDTQKPLELLDRLVLTCSQEGELVADLFSGSGTTLVSACKNNRNYLGCDSAILSLQTARARLLEQPNTDLTIYHTRPVNDNTNISLNTASRNGQIHIMLNGYSFLQPTYPIPHYEDGREYITYWAAGSLENDCFTVEDFAQRSAAHPILKDTLKVANGENIAVYFADALGNHRIIKL